MTLREKLKYAAMAVLTIAIVEGTIYFGPHERLYEMPDGSIAHVMHWCRCPW